MSETIKDKDVAKIVKLLTPDIQQNLIKAIKGLTTLGGIISLFYIYGSNRISKFFAWLLNNFTGSSKVVYYELRKILRKKELEKNTLYRFCKRMSIVSVIVLFLYMIFIVIGISYRNTAIIATSGIITSIFFLLSFFILEKSVMALGGAYDFSKNLILGILQIPKQILENLGVKFDEQEDKDNKENIQKSLHNLFFIPTILIVFSFIFTLVFFSFKFIWTAIVTGVLSVFILAYWQMWESKFWKVFFWSTCVVVGIMILSLSIYGLGKLFYPRATDAFATVHWFNDKEIAKEELRKMKPRPVRVITKIKKIPIFVPKVKKEVKKLNIVVPKLPIGTAPKKISIKRVKIKVPVAPKEIDDGYKNHPLWKVAEEIEEILNE